MAIPIIPIGFGYLGNMAYHLLPLPFSMRTPSAKCRKFLRVVEGLASSSPNSVIQVPPDKIDTYSGKIYAYDDHKGYSTIGFGHLRVSGDPLEITASQAWKLFDKDLERIRLEANTVFKNSLVTQGQYDALISLTYNLGPYKYKNTNFLHKILTGNLSGARSDFDFWNGDSNGLGLAKRRMVEHIFYLGKSFKGLHPSEISTADAQLFKQNKSVDILRKYEA